MKLRSLLVSTHGQEPGIAGRVRMSAAGSRMQVVRSMVPSIAIATFLFVLGCADRSPESGLAPGPDPIQELVDRLSADRRGGWVNGPYPRLDLPSSATVEEVLDRLFQLVTFVEGPVTRFRILELRGVVIGSVRPERYNAAIVDTNLGRKLVLFRRGRLDWWIRVYEVERTMRDSSEHAAIGSA
jgi:hypothetical protein